MIKRLLCAGTSDAILYSSQFVSGTVAYVRHSGRTLCTCFMHIPRQVMSYVNLSKYVICSSEPPYAPFY